MLKNTTLMNVLSYVDINRTSSMPISVPHYLLNMAQYLGLEFSLYTSNIMEWMFPLQLNFKTIPHCYHSMEYWRN